jgi:hypothetical protein
VRATAETPAGSRTLVYAKTSTGGMSSVHTRVRIVAGKSKILRGAASIDLDIYRLHSVCFICFCSEQPSCPKPAFPKSSVGGCEGRVTGASEISRLYNITTHAGGKLLSCCSAEYSCNL